MRGPAAAVAVFVALAALPAGAQDKQIRQSILDLRSREAKVRYQAVVRLGRRGSAAKSAVSALLKLLDDPVSYVSTEVRLTLRRVGGSNPNALVKGLKSKNVEIRRGVAQVLDWNWAPPRGAPGSPPRLPIKKLDALVAALDDPDEQVRKHMASALVTYGERAIPALVKALDSPKIHLRTAAATALGNMPKELALADLLGALRSRKAGTRAAAAYGLRFPKKSAHKIVPPVHRVLDDKEPQVRAAAAETLGLLGGYADVVVPSLVRHLDDADESVRAACLHACVRYGKDAVGPLMRALKTEERPAALVALPRIGWPAVAALTGALGDPDSRYRADCAECLGGIGSPADSAAPDLQRLLEDEYPYVRAAAAVGLGGIGPGAWKAAAGLTTTLEDKDAGVRASSAQALGRVGVGAKSVVTGLGKSLQDPQAKVRVASAFALWRLGEDHTAALKMLRSVVGDKAAPLPLRVQAAGVLRTMRWDAREAIPELAACFVVDGETADPPELRAVAAHALGEIASASGVGLVERPDRWGRERNKIVRATVDLGLEWLAAHQDLTGETLRGFWDADEFMKHDPAQDKCDGPGKALYDPGVTSLAVLSFLGLGYTDRGGANPYAKNVDGALSYLMSIQDRPGCFGPRNHQKFVYNHALSTLALCEGWLLTRDARYRHAAQLGLDFIASARNPYGAWRYGVRAGDNDTSVTAWMVMALRIGDLAGLRVDLEAFDGAANWLHKMSDPEFGVTGYIQPGGSPARPEGLQDAFPAELSQSMTSAAWWGRYLCGSSAWKGAWGPGLAQIREIPPVWDPAKGCIDLYYWHWGTLTMHQAGTSDWKKWRGKLDQALLPVQHAAGSGSRAGSWDPIGPWGPDGGRVYSTAMALLMLQTPYRYTRGFMDPPKLKEPFAAALPALKKAARDKNASVKGAAQHALARIRRDR